jgi:hypothetical protein
MAITVSSGFWNNSYSFIDGRHPLQRGVQRMLNKRGIRDVRELMRALTGVAPGAAALATYKRVTSDVLAGPSSNGGVRIMETVNLVNRPTTAADVTEITTRVLAFTPNPVFPVNGDGNPRVLAGG